MDKERKTMMLLMLGGIVWLTVMDNLGLYILGKWPSNEYLLTINDVHFVIEWTVFGFGLGLLAHGGRMKGIGISKAYLTAAFPVFLIGACSKLIYNIIPDNVVDWFYEIGWRITIPVAWFVATAGLLLFMGVSASHEVDGNREKKISLMICGVFLFLLFLFEPLRYRLLQINMIHIYNILTYVIYFLFGSVAALTAGYSEIEMSQKTGNVKAGILCLAFSLGGFFLIKWHLFRFLPRIFGDGARCAVIILVLYGGLFLTKGALERFRWKGEG
ncbi:hypothetical protein [Eubacterium callanderi]|uniref:hypothetical protein n=1 Tax=Eubacterium callanderi TaxID=53442 RepID=UPI001AA0BCBD|nr:hypothetical protein [Eubacterium callanderi]MBO1701414.1 hypothetical protein [Eubacterium callanderi]